MKYRLSLASLRIRSAILCGMFLIGFVASSLPVFSCQMPQYKGGLIDLHGREIMPCETNSLKYLGDGLFVSYEVEKSSDRPKGVFHFYNSDGKLLNPRVPEGWELTQVFVPHPNAMSEVSIDDLPTNSLLGLKRGRKHRLVDMHGKNVLSKDQDYLCCFPYDDFLVFSEHSMPEHLGADDPALFAFNPNTGQKFYGKDVERFVYKHDVPFERMNKKEIAAQIMKVNHLDSKSQWVDIRHPIRGQSTLFEPEPLDGWNDNLAVVYCGQKGSQGYKLGLINRNFEFVLAPEFSKLKYLRQDLYLSRKEKTDSCIAIDSHGKALSLFPPHTINAYVSDDLMVCEHAANGVDSRTAVSLIDCDGKVLHTVPNSRVESFRAGVAVLATNDWSCMWHDNVLSILTRDGVTASGLIGVKAEPTSNKHLLLSKLNLHLDWPQWANAVHGIRRELQFAYMLQELDLIGRTRTEIEARIGKPEQVGEIFVLESGNNTKDLNAFQIRYTGDRVSAWRWINRRGDKDICGPWNEKNVIVDWLAFSGYRRKDLVDWNTVKIKEKGSAVE